MLKIEVKDTTVRTRTDTKNGRDWKIRTQDAYVFTYAETGVLSAYPEKLTIDLTVGNGNIPDQPPFAAGICYLHPQSFYVGDYGQLRVGRPILVTEAEYKQIGTQLRAA